MVTAGNKKPLSSFPAEAESPRGAVLVEILGVAAIGRQCEIVIVV